MQSKKKAPKSIGKRSMRFTKGLSRAKNGKIEGMERKTKERRNFYWNWHPTKKALIYRIR